LNQKQLGDCWFVAAVAGICQNYSIFQKVVPFDNSFQKSKYTGLLFNSNISYKGAFHF
jgi:hypothetical protein